MAAEDEPLNPNPIVAMAMKIRARKDLGEAIDSAVPAATAPADARDVLARLDAFANALAEGAKRLNSILGADGVMVVRLERPLRLRVRFRGKRVALDPDSDRQLVIIRGEGLDGDYQFDESDAPVLIALSKLSTEAGYRDGLSAAGLLKTIAADAQLPRPAHLDDVGPLKL